LDISSNEATKRRNSRKVVKQGQDLLFSLCQSKTKWTLGMKADFRRLVQDETIPINGVNEEGLAPLLLLCWNQHSEILLELVKIVLERPDVDINVSDNGEWNALGMACRHCQSKTLINLVRLLLERGISVNSKNRDGDSALIVLCANYKHIGLLEIARLLIEHQIDINAINSFGWNALLSICYNFKSEILYDIIKILLEVRINVNQVDKNGNTALIVVCSQYKRENLIDIVRLLVNDYKINVKLLNNKGWDALFALLQNYHGSNIYYYLHL
jgi:ankyrin repeat protein